MRVAAKDEAMVRRPKASKGLWRTQHVAPFAGRAGARMDKEPLAVLGGQRQPCQKCSLRLIELRARPSDRRTCGDVHCIGRIANCIVVIAEHGNCADPYHFGRVVDDPCRVGALTDKVAKKSITVCSGALSVGKAGGQGLTVAVDIGKQRDQHSAF